MTSPTETHGSTGTAGEPTVEKAGLGRDFGWLWTGYGVSQMGSAIGTGALPLVAVLLLHSSTFQVSLLAALSAAAAAAVALPFGGYVEARWKRPTMIAADLVRFVALGSIPLAAALDVLTFTWLCVVGVVNGAATIVFQAAGDAYLKTLLPPEQRVRALSRLESTFWTANSTGPPLGGALISWLGATVTLVLDAVSHLLSALAIGRIRHREAALPPPAERDWRRDLTEGWRVIWRLPDLRSLWLNSLLFGGAILMASPLLTVLMLVDLGFAPWQYGLALGLAGAGGVLGAVVAPRAVARLGRRPVLLGFGAARCLWLGLLPLAPASTGGLVLIIVAEFALLLCAGIFNPTFTAYRMHLTPDTHMARMQTGWSVGTRGLQPLFIVAGGWLAAVTSVDTAMTAAAVLLLVSVPLLPWRRTAEQVDA